MKEINSISSNLVLLPLANGQVMASAELVILSTEPTYNLSGEEVVKARPVDAYRVLVNLRSVGGLIQALHSLGEELEKLEADYNSQLVPKPAPEPVAEATMSHGEAKEEKNP